MFRTLEATTKSIAHFCFTLILCLIVAVVTFNIAVKLLEDKTCTCEDVKK